MRVGQQEVIVIEVKASLVGDVFEANLAISAIELTCGQPVVLWAIDPCGCRELFGRREHIWIINEMPSDSIEWNDFDIDFARPVPLIARPPSN